MLETQGNHENHTLFFSPPFNERQTPKNLSLSQANNALASSDKLTPHGIATATGSLHGILVLVRAAEEVLHALAGAAPDEILVRGEGDGLFGLFLARGLVGFDELAADLVGHALELGERDVGLGGAGLEDGAAPADGLGVVGCEDDAGLRIGAAALDGVAPLAGQHAGGEVVEARVRLLLGVVEELTCVGAQVRAADELDAERDVLPLRNGEVVGQDLGTGLLVGLVGAVDDGRLGALVVLARKLHGPRVDAVLQHVLLGVEEQPHAAVVRELADGVDGLVQRGAGDLAGGELGEGELAGATEPKFNCVSFLHLCNTVVRK